LARSRLSLDGKTESIRARNVDIAIDTGSTIVARSIGGTAADAP
jgi:hypothetical protein